MSPVIVGIIGLIALFVLLAFRLPIGIGMALIGGLGIWYLVSGSAAMAKFATVPFDTAANYHLAVLPLFLLMSEVVFTTGMGSDLYTLAAKWLGQRRGGLAMATIAGCSGFAAVSGSSIATTATMGMVSMPEMKKYNYSPLLSSGSIAAGGSIGSLIPPSGILIIYGILTETSIGALFIAGLVPGILEAIFYITTIYVLCKWRPSLGPRTPSVPLKEKIFAFRYSGEVLALAAFVLGGLLIGWFTPTEAGAVGAAGAILIGFARRRLGWPQLKEAVVKTIKTTGMIYAILIGAFILNGFLAVSTIPNALAEAIVGLPLPPLAVMALIMLMYLLLGCVLDAAAMQVLTIPILFPLALELGFHPLWFGILTTRAMEIAMITPPIGINVYVLSGIVPEVPMPTIFKGILPFLAADVLNVILLLFVPGIILFLPSLM